MEIRTKSGFECDIDPKVLRDWRMVHAIKDVYGKTKAEKLQGMFNMALIVLGEDGMGRLENHVADDTGFIDSGIMEIEICEIIEKLKESTAKNS